ncbi:MAG: sigma factor-like helix-turn-helix DNA-binding protein, partial [Cyanobacteria bacterium P01_H01_bin.121]
TDQELAAQLQVSQGEWQQVRLAKRNRAPLSLDTLVTQQTETTMTLADTLLDRHCQELQASEENRQQLQIALVELDSETRAVIEQVYFQGISRRVVADQLGVSPMTISRRIRQGLTVMHDALDRDHTCDACQTAQQKAA